MKTLNLFLFLLLPFSLMGQVRIDTTTITPENFVMKSSDAFWACDSVIFIHQPKLDTVEVWINCAEMENRGLIAYNVSIKGWEVRAPKWVPAHWDGNNAYILAHWDIEKSYLNHFKQPLTGYIIWATKEIKK
jgi:hypothetical protein